MLRYSPSGRNNGALLDAELSAAVYVELTTSRQAALQPDPIKSAPVSVRAIVRTRPQPLAQRVTADNRNAHRAFVATLGADAVWLDYSFRGLERRSRAFG